jgi:hypothetical protein
MTPKGLLATLRNRIAQRIFQDTHIPAGYGTRDPAGDAPPELSPDSLLIRLEAAEQKIAERQAIRQLRVSARLARLNKGAT